MLVEPGMDSWLMGLEIRALKMLVEVAMEHFFATKYLYWVLLSAMLPDQKEDRFLMPYCPVHSSQSLLVAMRS